MITGKVVTIDCGKKNVKAIFGDKEVIYENKYSLNHTEDLGMLGENTYNVTYKNEEYTIGENASRSLFGEGKLAEEHIVSALVAVANLIKDEADKSNIILMYGESVNRYFNVEHKNDIKSRLEGTHEIIINDELNKFTIQYVHILPEGLGDILDDFENRQGVQYVVDIGGGTINFITAVNGRPIQEECHSFVLGVNNIVTKVGEVLNQEKVGDFQQVLLNQYIKYGCKSQKVQAIINSTIDSQLDLLDDKLKGFNVNLHEILKIDNVTFIGGGSELFKAHILKHYDGAEVINEPVWANARGFHKYGLANFEEDEVVVVRRKKKQ